MAELLDPDPKLHELEPSDFACVVFATLIVPLWAHAVVDPMSDTPTAAVMVASENAERRGPPRSLTALLFLSEAFASREADFAWSSDLGVKVFSGLSMRMLDIEEQSNTPYYPRTSTIYS